MYTVYHLYIYISTYTDDVDIWKAPLASTGIRRDVTSLNRGNGHDLRCLKAWIHDSHSDSSKRCAAKRTLVPCDHPGTLWLARGVIGVIWGGEGEDD